MQRDLTFNTTADSVAEEHPQNPFASEDESTGSSLNSRDNINLPTSESGQYGQKYAPYAGYYSQHGTQQDLLHGSASSEDHGSPGPATNADGMQVPSEFDRYPSMATSRVVSSTSLASQLHNMHRNESSASPDDSSTRSSDPFVSNVDFSPFGGYPASSFPLHIDEKEADDYLHNPDPVADAEYDKNRFVHDMKHMDRRSLFGLFGFIAFFIFAAMIFVVLPALTYTGATTHYKAETYEILTQYQYPLAAAIRTSLIDPDTPEDARTKKSVTGDEWVLTFSDEFNAEGRTFYDGDDQFFQAVDIHYDATHDLEWYDPDAVTTANGTLILRMDAIKNHNLYYRSGMVQSWNKLCFTQGMIVVSAMLPNYGNVTGLWPGLWTMGNLGRPGYLASTQGVWPYSYDSCDAGITANQSSPDGISYLPGQKLNVCTCPGGDHPNRGTARGAPEIDIIEGEVNTDIKVGVASQSLQLAPMDIWYMPDYNFVEIHNSEVTTMNTYAGGPFQQAVSGTSTLNVTWYQLGDHEHNFQNFGFEYLNDDDNGHLTWYVGDDPTFTMHAYALGPNGNIGFRRLSKEPMSIVLNLGISTNWAYIDWPSIHFPNMMHIDYVRVYQPEDEINMTCDPEDYPTSDYIASHKPAYYNANHTSWEDAGYSFPKNKLVHGC
ncbi:hypothetical protein OXX79_003485 [Metschnikowia pulcherrima]